MVETVVRLVPAGTSIDAAQRVMEAEGFECHRETAAKFLDREGLDYVYCVRSEGGIVQRRWQVALVHRNGQVVEALASTDLTGL